ncbi:hypothetical protein GWI33_012870 [Rhynchophorus ferrugineus]|uniref:Kindlin-2 N-terminal domain-containing protein n=1 Tax=Rhynchophorus ferrugineus TaxID=354439 RepID=A0A834MAK1_RHYFE|nr:hypothetical protein GWI33_012870 [Rhynchophorus ferrugineus]
MMGDGSWDLRVFVTDLQTERQIRVKGDVHIGGVMLRLVEDLGVQKNFMLSDQTLDFPEPFVLDPLGFTIPLRRKNDP